MTRPDSPDSHRFPETPREDDSLEELYGKNTTSGLSGLVEKPESKKTGPPPPPAGHRWKKGESGNPGGRPKRRIVSSAIERLLYQRIPPDHALVRAVPELKGKTWAEALAYGLVLEGVKGGTPAAREIMDRLEGPVRQEAPGGPAVNVNVLDEETAVRVAQAFLQRRGLLVAATGPAIEAVAELIPEPLKGKP
jgi:hypothetical protein